MKKYKEDNTMFSKLNMQETDNRHFVRMKDIECEAAEEVADGVSFEEFSSCALDDARYCWKDIIGDLMEYDAENYWNEVKDCESMFEALNCATLMARDTYLWENRGRVMKDALIIYLFKNGFEYYNTDAMKALEFDNYNEIEDAYNDYTEEFNKIITAAGYEPGDVMAAIKKTE